MELIHKHIFFAALSLRYELFPLRFFKQKGRVKHLLGRHSEFVCDFYTAVFTNCNFIVAFKPLFNVFFVIWQNFTAAKTCGICNLLCTVGQKRQKIYRVNLTAHNGIPHLITACHINICLRNIGGKLLFAVVFLVGHLNDFSVLCKSLIRKFIYGILSCFKNKTSECIFIPLCTHTFESCVNKIFGFFVCSVIIYTYGICAELFKSGLRCICLKYRAVVRYGVSCKICNGFLLFHTFLFIFAFYFQ